MIETILVGYDGVEGKTDALGLARHLAFAKESTIIDRGPVAADEIAEIAAEERPSMIAIASSERAHPGTVVPGAIADELLEAPTQPIAIAPLGFGHRRTNELRQLGVAYDGSDGARAALAHAAGIAAGSDGWLELLAVAAPPVEAVRGSRQPVQPRGVASDDRPPTRHALEEILADALEDADAEVSTVAEAAYGIPKRTLLRRTAALDLIAIGSRRENRSPNPLGAVATGLVFGGARCPVLVAPPAAERSPDYPSGGSRLART